MLVSILMPTFGRGARLHLVEEAIYSILRQDYDDWELIVCNDTPGLSLQFGGDRRVRMFNLPERFPTLSHKLRWMIERARGRVFMRQDDDDLCLPWRISYSLREMNGDHEWHPNAYWFAPTNGPLHYNVGHGNSHVTAIWSRECLDKIGGYPANLSGNEDQAFNGLLRREGLFNEQPIWPGSVFYIYRWGVSPHHLSGKKADADHGHQSHYDAIGAAPQRTGTMLLEPHWLEDYVELAKAAARDVPAEKIKGFHAPLAT